MQKIISFRADEQDLERIKEIKEIFKNEYHMKISTSDILSAGIMEFWCKQCLPYKEQGKLTF